MAGVGSVSPQFNVGKVLFSSSDVRGEIPSGGLHQGQYSNLENRLGPAYKVELSTQAQTNSNSPEIRHLKQTGAIECQTCKQRKYQDVSNDSGVSFKAPGYISPESSAAVVGAHEQEHVTNEQANARTQGRKVVSQSVRLFSAVCPECGKVYISGGETHTTTATDTSQPLEPLNKRVDLVT